MAETTKKAGFPDSQRIQGWSIGGMASDIASVRRGEAELTQVPWMQKCNAKTLKKRLEVAAKGCFDRNNPADMKEYSDRIKESWKNPEKARELADYRLFELTSDVMATPFALGAFQAINLSADELPGIIRPRSRNLQRFSVRSIGQDGGARQDQIQTTKTFASYEMDLLSTDKIEYPLRDIQQGEVEGVDMVNRELAYDMEMKIDELALTNITAAQTASGLRDLLNVHTSIVSANLPDTNYLDLTASDTGTLTITKLKSILSHVAQFGVVGGDGVGEGLTIKTIMMSPQNLRDPWDFIDLVSGVGSATEGVAPGATVPSSVREQIYQTGMFTNAWGYNFSWIPNGQIDAGKMYVFFNQPLGWFFTKTEFDQMIKWEGPTELEQNYGQMVVQKCLRFVVPDLWKHRLLIVDF